MRQPVYRTTRRAPSRITRCKRAPGSDVRYSTLSANNAKPANPPMIIANASGHMTERQSRQSATGRLVARYAAH